MNPRLGFAAVSFGLLVVLGAFLLAPAPGHAIECTPQLLVELQSVEIDGVSMPSHPSKGTRAFFEGLGSTGNWWSCVSAEERR